jgi:glucose-6-phosphate isomerase
MPQLWDRFKKHLCVCDEVGFTLDISRMSFPDDLFERMRAPLTAAFDEMDALEKGAIDNPDENRRVGHYGLRAPELAPDGEHADAIRRVQRDVKAFARAVHRGKVKPQRERSRRCGSLTIVHSNQGGTKLPTRTLKERARADHSGSCGGGVTTPLSL